MSKYKGIPCPVCNKEFTDNDDIVVCPDCGAPYHRSCYNEKGACIFDNLHAEHKDWQMPKIKTEAEYEIKDVECPRCGTLNSHSAVFCNRCGLPLGTSTDTNHNPYRNFNNLPNDSVGGTGSIGGMYRMFDPMGGVNPTEAMADDITYGEVSKIVQQNTIYYIPTFKRTREMNSSRFNFAAFLFTGGWMLYRKMYKQGIIATVIWLVLYLSRALVSLLFVAPKFRNITNSLSSASYSTELTERLTALMQTDEKFFLASMAVTALTICIIVFMIICGAKANKMYMKHCESTIREIRNQAKDGDGIDRSIYEDAITLKGGTNTILAVILMIGYLVLSSITAG